MSKAMSRLLTLMLIWTITLSKAEENASETKIKVDKEHIAHDFAGLFGFSEVFQDFELEFQYFMVHDFDENNRLDGLELLQALNHHHDNETTPETSEISFKKAEKQVDDIFKNHDTNNDGFLDYKEFMSVQGIYPDLSGGIKTVERSG